MHDLGVVHGNLESVSRDALCLPPLRPSHVHTHVPQTNVVVDTDGTPRITGLGSAFIQSSPVTWAEEPPELTRCTAPELVNPGDFELPRAQVTKPSDIYAFGVLAYEVSIRLP